MIIPIILYGFLTFTFVNSYKYIRFKNIDYNNKINRKYKQVNFLKSITLGFFFPLSLYVIYSLLILNKIPVFISLFGSLYASLDMSSTIYNFKDNHISTNIHHISVQLLFFYCLYYEWNIISLCKPIILYAAFSSLSFLVNYRLAIRGTINNEKIINTICLYSYSLFSVINWIIQINLIIISDEIKISLHNKMLYIGILLFIIYDDLFLIKYLHKNKIN